MSVRFLFVGDQHFDSVPPQSRKDDYLEALKLKVQEIRDIAVDRRVHGVIWLGDLFHKQDAHRVPYSVTNWLMKYFGSYPSEITNYLVMGNHDVKANSQNWRRQPIGTLVHAGVVCPLWQDKSEENPLGTAYVRIAVAETKVTLSGQQFSYETDFPGNRVVSYSSPFANEGIPGGRPFHIQACHSALIPDTESTFGPFTRAGDLDKVLPAGHEATLYICGHLHDFYGSFSSGRIKVLNFGSLARGSIDEYNLKRKVKIGYLEIISKPDCTYHAAVEEIVLKSAKPANDVFYVEEFKRKKQRSEDLDRLAEMLSAGTLADEFRIINPDEALEVLLRAKHVRPEVEKLVRDNVKQARVELNQ